MTLDLLSCAVLLGAALLVSAYPARAVAGLCVAASTCLVRAGLALGPGWRGDLGTALWLGAAAVLFALLVQAFVNRDVPLAPRPSEPLALTPLAIGYALVSGLVSATAGHAEGPATTIPITAWLVAHIVAALTPYALVTLAALYALAALIQDAALRGRSLSPLASRLPSLAACDRWQRRLTEVAFLMMGLALGTGMALGFVELGRLLAFDHKTVLSITAIMVLAAMVCAQRAGGIGLRFAARLVLAAHLLLTLAYPGVKFVAEVLIADLPTP